MDDHKQGLAELRELMGETYPEMEQSASRLERLASTVKTIDHRFRADLQRLERVGSPCDQALDLTPSHTLLALLRRSVKKVDGAQVWSPHAQLPAGVSVSLETHVKRTITDVTHLSESFNLAFSVSPLQPSSWD